MDIILDEDDNARFEYWLGLEEDDDDDEEQNEEEVDEDDDNDDDCWELSESLLLDVEPIDSQLCTETRLHWPAVN